MEDWAITFQPSNLPVPNNGTSCYLVTPTSIASGTGGR